MAVRRSDRRALADAAGDDGMLGWIIPSWEAGEIDFRRLYDHLVRLDDEPSYLVAAEHCLRHRLARLATPAPDDAQAGQAVEPTASAGSCDDRAVDEMSPGALHRIGEHWLASEAIVLQRIVQAVTAEDSLHLSLFDLYRRWWAVVPPVWPESTPDDRWVEVTADAAQPWEPAVIRYALGCTPEQRQAEILGYLREAVRRIADITACHQRAVGERPQAGGRASSNPPRLDRLAAELPVIEVAIGHLLRRAGPGTSEHAALTGRLAQGAALQKSLWADILASDRRRRFSDPADALAAILQHKAHYAAGYHASVRLAGRSLDDWFRTQPFDGAGFLEALADSGWVDRLHPGRSRLLKLLEFDGPMFGVFGDAERDVLTAWLDSLSPYRPASPAAGRGTSVQDAAADALRKPRRVVFGRRIETDMGRPEREISTSSQATRCSERALFHRLVNVEREPAVLPLARRHAAGCLAAASGRWIRRRTWVYTERRFADWIERQYRMQLRQPRKSKRPPRLSREAYRFGIEQLAPSILVDGCWLQRVAQLSPDMPEVTRRLVSIYTDELGDGVHEHNHPRVYRRLLHSLGIELPPLASPDFAHHPGFLDAAFDLPVFMLAISLSPHCFLPELLGLNLAIELSGLGTLYSRVAGELDYWGIDSRIVRLHQSIDNLAGGHAALARDCVILHLAQVRALGGEPAVQQHWRRVWTGYRSLNAVTGRFRRHLVLRYAGLATVRRIRSWRHPATACG